MAATPKTVTVDVEIRLNGEPIAGALVVGPDDRLVVNLGVHADLAAVDRVRALIDLRPDLRDRVLFVSGESMAVVRAEESDEQRRERLADDLRVLHKRGYTRP